jgi:hypothetical protein
VLDAHVGGIAARRYPDVVIALSQYFQDKAGFERMAGLNFQRVQHLLQRQNINAVCLLPCRQNRLCYGLDELME